MESEESSIERLKRTLYSRDEKIVPKEKRTPVSGRTIDAPTDWGTNSSFDILNDDMVKKNNSFFNKFLIGSFGFFFIALGVALFIFFGGINMISSNNLNIEIISPSSVSSGEEFIMVLSIINGNRTDLEEVDFIVDYPEGVLSVVENKPLSREKINLGTILSGDTKEHTIRAILSGEKEAIKTFNFKIEYKVKGSNAIFAKEKTYDVVINSSPIIMELSYPEEINSGQEITLSISVTSNSNVIMKNTLVKIEYPYGFTYKNSNIKPLLDSSQTGVSVWNIGDLKNGDKKTLSILGTLVGQNLEDRSFKVYAGTQKSNEIADFNVTLATDIATVGIRKSFFDLSVVASEVSMMGRDIPVIIKWQNILPDKVLNMKVEAALSGNILDRSTVRVNNGGFYRSVGDVIVWDKNSTASLIDISPGDSGQVSFSVSSVPSSFQSRLIKNPHIDAVIKITGDRLGEETSEVSSTENITIKFPSILTFTAKTFRGIGPFTNTGPIPPQADKESTYTVTWTLTNTSNDLKDTIITAILPAGVDWKNEISPPGERLIFNPETRTISWNVGNVALGTGFTYSAKEVSFKIGIVPSVSQVGFVPDLLSKLTATATDTYTETQLTSQISVLTTQYSDPDYKNGDNVVGQ